MDTSYHSITLISRVAIDITLLILRVLAMQKYVLRPPAGLKGYINLEDQFSIEKKHLFYYNNDVSCSKTYSPAFSGG